MENPRPEKVAVVEEVRDRISSTEAVVFTEYRGLTVHELQDLRKALRAVGGDYKVYKNSLVRRATVALDLDLGDTLTGPTALAFVGQRVDGSPGDAVLVAKAIKAFAKSNPNLLVKGGRLGEQMLDVAAVMALADVAPREELLARLAGGIAAPMTNFARLMQAVPLKMAYGLQALIDVGGAEGAPVAETPAPGATGSEGTGSEGTGSSSTEAELTETDNDPAPAEHAEAAAGDDADSVGAEAAEKEE